MAQSTSILISLPTELAARMRASISPRNRSKVIRSLIEKEIEKREKKLFECAKAVEADRALNKEMSDWDVTITDGLKDNESW